MVGGSPFDVGLSTQAGTAREEQGAPPMKGEVDPAGRAKADPGERGQIVMLCKIRDVQLP